MNHHFEQTLPMNKYIIMNTPLWIYDYSPNLTQILFSLNICFSNKLYFQFDYADNLLCNFFILKSNGGEMEKLIDMNAWILSQIIVFAYNRHVHSIEMVIGMLDDARATQYIGHSAHCDSLHLPYSHCWQKVINLPTKSTKPFAFIYVLKLNIRLGFLDEWSLTRFRYNKFILFWFVLKSIYLHGSMRAIYEIFNADSNFVISPGYGKYTRKVMLWCKLLIYAVVFDIE